MIAAPLYDASKNFMPDSTNAWMVTIACGLLGAFWVAWDIRNLIKIRHADRSDPIVADKRFGFICGIIIGLIGVVGVSMYHLR